MAVDERTESTTTTLRSETLEETILSLGLALVQLLFIFQNR